MAKRYPNVFRTARFIPAVEYLTAVCVTWLCSRLSIIERVRYHCAQYGRRTYGANMLTGNPCITLPAGIAAAGVAPSITFIGGKLYSEATITLANKFQQITLYQQQHPPMFTK
jgi:Asp-tRNA(Asn)/Glu-tRNA(Gln) amidotransferase A subunit family amidase